MSVQRNITYSPGWRISWVELETAVRFTAAFPSKAPAVPLVTGEVKVRPAKAWNDPEVADEIGVGEIR
jgi:hypothetical protein